MFYFSFTHTHIGYSTLSDGTNIMSEYSTTSSPSSSRRNPLPYVYLLFLFCLLFLFLFLQFVDFYVRYGRTLHIFVCVCYKTTRFSFQILHGLVSFMVCTYVKLYIRQKLTREFRIDNSIFLSIKVNYALLRIALP